MQSEEEQTDKVRDEIAMSGLGLQLSWYSTCLACVRPWVQSPTLPRIKEDEREGGGKKQ